MNDFGFALAWLAIQVAFLLIPAILLQALASRKGPAPGAWVATWSLALVVVLGVSMAWPLVDWRTNREPASMARTTSVPTSAVRPIDASGPIASHESSDRSTSRVLTLETIRAAWSRFERRAAEPVSRFRPWGRIVAIVGLAGSGLGLVRLTLGLWAVGLCRRRGRVVLDPALLGLMDELRASMGCRPTVEVREVPDLATPATAGWRRPLLLLPDDWRTWDESERRAVLAHELAHILRGDYAAGLVARLALVIHFYHPLVRWMAARLTLQQELAADALGAEFTGGRTSYLVALSSLALKQDGRSPSWPVRAFLPTRGTLIRRIKMLRDDNGMSGRGWSKWARLAIVCGLVALTVGVASLKKPARAADEPAKAKLEPVEELKPFDVSYVPDGMTGVFAIHPARLVNRPGMELLEREIRERLLTNRGVNKDGDIVVDRSLSEALNLTCKDIESVVVGLKFGRQLEKPKDQPVAPAGTLEFHGLTIRAVAPFDWMGLLRKLKLGYDQERRTDRSVYYKIAEHDRKTALVPGECAYLPDDRTVVFGDEKWIKTLIAREKPTLPAYLGSPDWERASRALVAAALDNTRDGFARWLSPGEPQDAAVLGLLKGVERLTVGVEEANALAIRLDVTGQDTKTSDASALAFKTLIAKTLEELDESLDLEELAPGIQRDQSKLFRKLLSTLKVRPNGSSFSIVSEGFGKLADFAAFIKADIEMDIRAAEMEARKAEEKTKKR